MAKKTAAKPKEKRPIGHPTQYRPEFCQMLMTHMGKGGSFQSFGADAGCCRSTLYAWEEAHPEFLDAKKKGTELSLKFYEEMGKAIAMGQIRTVKSEKPMLDKKGRPILDPNTGQVLYEREYMTAHASTGAWAFIMKNMHKWTDNRNVALSGDGNGAPIKIQPVERTAHDDLREIQEVQKWLKELDDARLTIDAVKIKD